MKVLHLLASSTFSGAENVACQIIRLFEGEIKMSYCSPNGNVKKSLAEKCIDYLPINKLTYKNVKKVVEKFKPDLIHAHDVRASIIASRFSKKIKIISHIHVNNKNMSRYNFKTILYNYSTFKYSHIFFVSKSCYENYIFKDKIENKASILYNVINGDDVVKLSMQEKILNNYDAIYVGRFTFQKNPLKLIEILARVVKQKNDFILLCLGDGELLEETKKKAKEMGVEKNVIFKGFLKNPLPYIANAKFMIMTSFYEGTPISALEAMALEKPIISTPVDGLKDLIENGINGFLCEEIEDFCEKISFILNDNIAYKNLCSNSSKKFNSHCNLENYKKELIKYYER